MDLKDPLGLAPIEKLDHLAKLSIKVRKVGKALGCDAFGEC
jgi:hypothetical protein